MDRELDLVKLFKGAGCYLGGKSNRPKAQIIFRDFLDTYLESVGISRRVEIPKSLPGTKKVGSVNCKTPARIEFAVDGSRVRVRLGSYDTPEEASRVYLAVNSHRVEIIGRLKGIQDKDAREALVNDVKTYIP